MRLPDLSIRQRLAVGFGVVLILLAGQLTYSLLEMRANDSLTDRLVSQIDPREALGRDLRVSYLNQAIALRTFAITKEPVAEQAYRGEVARAETAWDDLDGRPLDAEERNAVAGVRSQMDEYANLAAEFLSAVSENEPGDLIALEAQLAGIRDGLVEDLSTFVALEQTRAGEARAAISANQDQALRGQVALAVIIALAVLATAVVTTRAVRQPALRLVRAARALGGGDFGPALAIAVRPASPTGYRDELHELGDSFARMAHGLQSRQHRLETQGRVSSVLAADLDVQRLTAGALRELLEFARCEVGIVYHYDAAMGNVTPVGALGVQIEAVQTLRLGEDVPGRALQERGTVVLRDIPADTRFVVGLGFDRAPARTVLGVPMEVGDRVIGVLLLASLHDVPADVVAFIEAAADQIGVSLQNAMAHDEISVLALQLQDQNEELQAQNEEIQVQNEEIRQQAEEIQVQNEELQVQNEELDAQRASLIEVDRQKDEFLSIAVHELRSPITGIKGWTQLMRRSVHDQPELAEFDDRLATIDQLANILTGRINRLLDVTRARMGDLVIQPKPFDLVALTRECVEEWRARAEGRAIHFESRAEVVIGNWDQNGIRQVVDNLIENALRYSPNGEPVHVSAGAEDGSGWLTVTDSGIGIRDEALPRIFDLYYRDEASRLIDASGLGLGLYISKQLVSAHNGDIEVVSTVGLGTTFTVRLPLGGTVPSQ